MTRFEGNTQLCSLNKRCRQQGIRLRMPAPTVRAVRVSFVNPVAATLHKMLWNPLKWIRQGISSHQPLQRLEADLGRLRSTTASRLQAAFLPVYCWPELISCSLVPHASDSLCTLLVTQTLCLPCLRRCISTVVPYTPPLDRNLLLLSEVPNGKLHIAPIPHTFLKLLHSSHVGTETSQAGLRNIIRMWYLMIINDCTEIGFVVDFTPGVALPVVSDMTSREPDYRPSFWCASQTSGTCI